MERDDPSQYIPGALSLAVDEVAKRGLTGQEARAADPPALAKALLESVKEGVKTVGDAMRPGTYLANEQKIVCAQYKNERFREQRLTLNTRGLTFFKLGKTEKVQSVSGPALVTNAPVAFEIGICGFHYFRDPPKRPA